MHTNEPKYSHRISGGINKVHLIISVLIVQCCQVEVAVKKIVSGEKVGTSGALRNPEALDLYRDIPELKV